MLLLSLAACSSPDDPAKPNGSGGDNGVGTGGSGMGGDGMGGDVSQPLLCDFGEDAMKCEARADLACTPAGTPTGVDCSRDEDCQSGELCFEKRGDEATSGVCLALFGTCNPVCGGDFDCTEGEHCDPKSGACSGTAPSGSSFGETCDSDLDCRGLCVEVNSDVSECEEYCRVGAKSGCGKETLQSSGVACAFFAYDLSGAELPQGDGDVGVCAELCSCNDDCPGAQLCLNQPTDGHAGICAGGIEEEESIPCDLGLGGAPNE